MSNALERVFSHPTGSEAKKRETQFASSHLSMSPVTCPALISRAEIFPSFSKSFLNLLKFPLNYKIVPHKYYVFASIILGEEELDIWRLPE